MIVGTVVDVNSVGVLLNVGSSVVISVTVKFLIYSFVVVKMAVVVD